MIRNFRSDNCSPVLEEIVQALARDQAGVSTSTGGLIYDDSMDEALQARFEEVFGVPLVSFCTPTGTGANALAIASMIERPDCVIVCHQYAHILVSEESGSLLFSGARAYLPLTGEHGRISPATLTDALAKPDGPAEGSVLSLTQATETGTVYSVADMAEIVRIAHAHGLKVHVDGARLANALVALDVGLAEFVKRTAIDALTFGSTKLGGMAADAVILFRPSADIAAKAKRLYRAGGQRLSKRRFLNVQLLRFLADDLWLRTAKAQNDICAAFVKEIAGTKLRFAHPVETNQVFIPKSQDLYDALDRASIRYTRWRLNLIRLVFAHHHSAEDVRVLGQAVVGVASRQVTSTN